VTPSAVLALDLGTTSLRALAVTADGRIRAQAARALASRFPRPGWIEQDPREWWAASVAAMREALERSRLAARDVAAIGVVAQRATAVAWDAETGAPLAPAIGWQDARTEPRVGELVRRGIPVSTMASATKFEWLLAEAPALREAARRRRLRLGTPDAWLTDRLTGGAVFATDASQASCTGLYDLRATAWSEAALRLFGLEPDWLPALVPTSAAVADTAASLLGAPIPVAARAGDQQAATFAQDAREPGRAKLTLGTSAMLDLHTGARPAKPPRGAYPLALWELASGERGFCLEGTVVTAGAAVTWLVELGLLAGAASLDAVARATPTSDGVVFVPALQGLGTPFLDAGARAALFGATRGTRAEHVVRAVLDGVAQRCADVCDALPLAPGPLRVDGGLARSTVLLETLADLTGRCVLRAAETETTALGAAYLAGLAGGLWPDAASAVGTAAAPLAVEPRADAEQRERRRAEWRRALARVSSARR
jgi:glycerol kinase